MTMMIVGVLVWSGVHFIPMAAGSLRARLVKRLGEPAYKGGFALTLVAAITLMVFGWRSMAPFYVYQPPAWGPLATHLVMALALVLFVASGLATNIRRVLRHPQLTGFALWCGAHLLSNGDGRSLVLFGGLGLWAILAIALLSRRDGPWVKPAPQPIGAEWKPLAGAAALYAIFFLAHPYIAGISTLPG